MPDTTDSTTNTPPEAVGAASQPTPGPWTVDGCIVTAPAFYRDEPITHFEDGREQPNVTALVALVYDPRRCGDGWNARANARLIAAAPDYYEATERLTDDVTALDGDLSGYVAVPMDALDALLSAHLKATGRDA